MISRKNILKIALITSVATFTVLTHHNALKNKQLKKPIQINYKTDKEIYKEWMDNYNKAKKENEVRELAEKQKQEELKRQEQSNLSRGGTIEERTFILTFYTGLEEENSSAGSVNCLSQRLRDGMAANNVLPLHTRIYLNGYGEVEILDRGGTNFNTEERLDIFIPRNSGENDYKYKKRVDSMGRVKVKGYIIK